MSIDDSFYKNVFLLMQVVSPSFHCAKHFKQGMFEKPNQTGFIHISHYLLSIYDAKRFQKIVTWPVLNKKDETQYRLKVKEYIELLATENSDMNFPPILMIHIMRAGGPRFLTTMWKLSQISLRAYITRHYNGKLLQAPDTGDIKNISSIYITNINMERKSTIFKLYEETKLAIENVEQYIQCKSNELKILQTAVFETVKNIQKCLEVAPCSSIIKKRLADPKDVEIIDLWKTSIYANIEHLHCNNTHLYSLKSHSSKIIDIVSSLCPNAVVLNENKLPEGEVEKHMGSTLYINGSLVFHSLLLTLNEVLKQMKCCLKRNDLLNFSSCKITIKEHIEIIKSVEEEFQKFIVEVANISCNLQSNLQRKAINYTIQNDSFYFTCQNVFHMDPKLQFSLDDCVNNEKLINKLYMSPEKGRYKYLFTRYKNNKLSKKALESSSFINCSESKSINWFTAINHTLGCKISSPCHNKKCSPRYSKLFSSRNTNRHFAGTCNTSSPVNHVEKCLESKDQTIDLKAMDVKMAIKTIYEFSNQITEIAASLYKS